MYTYALPPALCTRKGSYLLPYHLQQEVSLSFGKFTRTVLKHFYENYCTLFPALKQKEVFLQDVLHLDLSALMQLSIITFGGGFYILLLL